MPSGEHRKSCVSNLFVSFNYLMVASGMLVLYIVLRSSLPCNRISVNWPLLKSKILGTVQMTVFKRVILSVNSLDREEVNGIKFRYLHHNCISD